MPLLSSPSDANSNSSDGSCPFWSDVDGPDKKPSSFSVWFMFYLKQDCSFVPLVELFSCFYVKCLRNGTDN